MNAILLSTASYFLMDDHAQKEVLRVTGLSGIEAGAPVGDVIPPANLATDDDGEGPVELTVAMVRKLTDKLSDKTVNVLKIIARNDSPQFHMKDVIAGTPGAEGYMDMRGIWSALTRRTRNITDDSAADLIWWTGGWILDGDGNQVDHVGEIAPLTYRSLRSHFSY
jgi:hypothetical protein